MKKKIVELPIIEPIYSTYHSQGTAGAIIDSNPSIRNWYLNHVMILSCNRKFLHGYTSPLINIASSAWTESPNYITYSYSMRHVNGYINPIIRELIDNGFYVAFDGVDDYYVENKGWYRKRHFNHDGLICGYDQEKKTYSLFAYDSNWVYRKFTISQQSFNKGRCAMMQNGIYGHIYAIKPKMHQIEFRPDIVLRKLKEYLDSSFEKYPTTQEGVVFGVVVHDYIAMYLNFLLDGSIAYERMDSRVFRVLWEHKKIMLERLHKMEKTLHIDAQTSTVYKQIVTEADALRMLYASHHKRRRDSLLPIIRKRLLELKEREICMIAEFIDKVGGVMKE